MKKENPSKATSLRQKAEEQLKKKSLEADTILSEADTMKLIHELQVHQIELEMQNHELILAKAHAEDSFDSYKEIYDYAPIGYFTLSKECEISKLNLLGAKMLGKRQLQLLGSRFGFFVSDDTKPIFNLFFEKVFSSNVKEWCEATLLVNNNLSRPVLISGIVLENKKECFMSLVDITGLNEIKDELISANIELAYQRDEKQKRADELAIANVELSYQNDEKQKRADELAIANIELAYQSVEKQKRADELAIAIKQVEEREAFINSIVQCTSDWIWEVNEQGMYCYCSERVVQILGYTVDEIIGKSPFDFMAKEELERVGSIFQNIIQARKPIIDLEYWNIHKDGHLVCLLTNGVPKFDETGKFTGYIGADKDVTIRKQGELIIKQQNNELQKLNADKDRFISILGHDLRSPFTALIGLSEICEGNIQNLNNEQIKYFVENINITARNTLSLLDDILMWASTQLGKISFIPQNLSFEDISNNVLETLNTTANAKNITINYSATDYLTVFADGDMLKTVLRNLISNAIKFTNNGGVININAEQIGSNTTISVSDNGIGINPDNIEKLFDISQVFTTKGTAAETGTGIGLLLCKDFVEKHGGKIWVESEVQKGSTFYFTIPFNPVSEKANEIENAVSSEQTEVQIKKLKILIVEDNEPSTLILNRMVRKISTEVLNALTGEQAIDLCQNNPDLDLVLMDIQMPKMDGYEATKQIRQFNKDVIIIAQTACAFAGDDEKAMDAGCNDYITKPIHMTHLYELIGKYFGN